MLWIAIGAMLIACQQEKIDEDAAELNENNPILKDSAYTVSIIESQPQLFVYPVVAQGKIEARTSVPLSFRTSGKLQQLSLANGQYIKKGATLATLFNEDLRLQLEEAQIALRKAEIDFSKLLVDYPDSLNRQYWKQIREDLQLQARLPQAQIDLRQAELAYRNTFLRAPFSGIVDGLSLEKGAMISSGQTLANLQDIRSFEVTTELLEFDIPRLQKGDKAKITPLYDPEIQVTGQVVEIDPRVKKNGYVTVKIRIPHKKAFITGMSVNVELQIPYERSIVVPKKAVVQKSGKPVIFTVEGQQAKWNYVTLGKDNGREVQVLDGIEAGKQVVISNNLQLAHDAPVRIAASNEKP